MDGVCDEVLQFPLEGRDHHIDKALQQGTRSLELGELDRHAIHLQGDLGSALIRHTHADLPVRLSLLRELHVDRAPRGERVVPCGALNVVVHRHRDLEPLHADVRTDALLELHPRNSFDARVRDLGAGQFVLEAGFTTADIRDLGQGQARDDLWQQRVQHELHTRVGQPSSSADAVASDVFRRAAAAGDLERPLIIDEDSRGLVGLLQQAADVAVVVRETTAIHLAVALRGDLAHSSVVPASPDGQGPSNRQAAAARHDARQYGVQGRVPFN
mmetsp:Transcript_78650/g.228258  ORF Transcript_78650/g.228258 Transcript_78650/m.228258 type:complete len:272 (-) Transcript_78650:9-824(-)